jgi:hypothetical protein
VREEVFRPVVMFEASCAISMRGAFFSGAKTWSGLFTHFKGRGQMDRLWRTAFDNLSHREMTQILATGTGKTMHRRGL